MESNRPVINISENELSDFALNYLVRKFYGKEEDITTSWSLGGFFIEKFKIELSFLESDLTWDASILNQEDLSFINAGRPLIAVAKLLVVKFISVVKNRCCAITMSFDEAVKFLDCDNSFTQMTLQICKNLLSVNKIQGDLDDRVRVEITPSGFDRPADSDLLSHMVDSQEVSCNPIKNGPDCNLSENASSSKYYNVSLSFEYLKFPTAEDAARNIFNGYFAEALYQPNNFTVTDTETGEVTQVDLTRMHTDNKLYAASSMTNFIRSSFSFTIRERILIGSKGTVLLGVVKSGTVHVGDDVILKTCDGEINLKVSNIEFNRNLVNDAYWPEEVGIFFNNVDLTFCMAGDILKKLD